MRPALAAVVAVLGPEKTAAADAIDCARGRD
jgi:hypothetical protein